MLPSVRAFLGELLCEVKLGRLPARAWLKVVGQVLKLTSGNRTRKEGKEIRIHWQVILPLKTIAASNFCSDGTSNVFHCRLCV